MSMDDEGIAQLEAEVLKTAARLGWKIRDLNDNELGWKVRGPNWIAEGDGRQLYGWSKSHLAEQLAHWILGGKMP